MILNASPMNNYNNNAFIASSLTSVRSQLLFCHLQPKGGRLAECQLPLLGCHLPPDRPEAVLLNLCSPDGHAAVRECSVQQPWPLRQLLRPLAWNPIPTTCPSVAFSNAPATLGGITLVKGSPARPFGASLPIEASAIATAWASKLS